MQKVASPYSSRDHPGERDKSAISLEHLIIELAFQKNDTDMARVFLKRAMEFYNANRGFLIKVDNELNPSFMAEACLDKKISRHFHSGHFRYIIKKVCSKILNCAAAGTPLVNLLRSNQASVILPLSRPNGLFGICYMEASSIGASARLYSDEMIQCYAVEGAMMLELAELYYQVGTIKRRKKPAGGPDASRQFLEAAKYIRANSTEKLNKKKFANMMGMNPDYFARQFKHVTGKTLCTYINEVRLEEATRMLSIPRKKIIDIAMDAGFESLRTFNREFKRKFGKSPRQFREGDVYIQ